MPRPFAGSLEDTPRPLLADSLAAQPLCICDLHNPGVAFGCGVDRVLIPQPHAILVHLRYAEPWIPDSKASEAAGEEKILVMVPALG